ncbi:MAG: hypothetical protein WCK29_01585 [archaeon]
MNIKVIPNVFQDANGLRRTWSVIIDGIPKYTYNTEEEVKAFLRGLNNGTN